MYFKAFITDFICVLCNLFFIFTGYKGNNSYVRVFKGLTRVRVQGFVAVAFFSESKKSYNSFFFPASTYLDFQKS